MYPFPNFEAIHFPTLIQTSSKTFPHIKIDKLPSTMATVHTLHSVLQHTTIGVPQRYSRILPNVTTAPSAQSNAQDIHNVRNATRQANAPNAPPVWFVFGGVGSQWIGMGSQLIEQPSFMAAIRQCSDTLVSNGINLFEMIRTNDARLASDTVPACCAVTAIQIALVDLLSEANVTPSGFIGHSIGEVACAYADGALSKLTAMKTIYTMASHARKCHGKMAAIALSVEEVLPMLTKGVDLVCDNSSESVTIGGSAPEVIELVNKLKSSGTLATIINTTNVAFHTRAMTKIKGRLIQSLARVIKTSSLRSARWISTSSTNNPTCSPEYFAESLTTLVTFKQALSLIPQRDVIIELSPHNLLTQLIKDARGCESVFAAASKKDSNCESLTTLFDQLHHHKILTQESTVLYRGTFCR
eukprot:m.269436 g.269436  ORF g.269436 m.269436 type:complete len:414 (-) comp84059_c0_seq1:137-1378(-)